MAASSAIGLLGEPRVKNGLTYYPGVQTARGTVLLGNVVRLQLQAEGAQPYIGYGFLKGLWLWKDQPYIRVQYMAPVRTDLPPDAIACDRPRAVDAAVVRAERLLQVRHRVVGHRREAVAGLGDAGVAVRDPVGEVLLLACAEQRRGHITGERVVPGPGLQSLSR